MLSICQQLLLTYFIVSQLFLTVLSFIMCLYTSIQLWMPTGRVMVADKYINKHLYLLITILCIINYLFNVYLLLINAK